MLETKYIVGALIGGVILSAVLYARVSVPRRQKVTQMAQIEHLVPKNPDDVEAMVTKAKEEIVVTVDAICNDTHRTFDTTILPMDTLTQHVQTAMASLYGMTLVHPDEALRDAAQQAYVELQNFWTDTISMNAHLYEAIKAYKKRLDDEQYARLTPERALFVDELLKGFKRLGLELPLDQQERVKAIKKELSQASMEFDRACSQARHTIEVPKEALKGMSEDFIAAREKTQDGMCIVSTDAAEYKMVLEHCEVAGTRKALYEASQKRAYPENQASLEKIIALQDELAQLLGCVSHADYVLTEEMVGSTERADSFLHSLIERAQKKEQQEFAQLAQDLHSSVELSKDGKLYPWDVYFAYNYYKKKHLNVDEEKIADYFPLQSTLDGLLKIYEDFFGLRFKKVDKVNLWHPDVIGYEVYKNGQLRGTALLDLHPRPKKYFHACHSTFVPALKDERGKIIPAVSLLICNFPKPTASKPSVLSLNDARTFFHEFGHLLHAFLGATELATFSGTSTKRDFVEMPSQMLEEWLWDKDILRSVSSHVKTQQPLPGELIDAIIASKHCDTGAFVVRQLTLGSFALDCYRAGALKDPVAMWQKSCTIRCCVEPGPDVHGYCAFPHLTGYGPRYYGYLWSKVFALDLFDKIKRHGLRDAAIGERYINEVLSYGGSKDPNDLLRGFLGREQLPDAFFKDLGI